jgi:hypothetical protein
MAVIVSQQQTHELTVVGGIRLVRHPSILGAQYIEHDLPLGDSRAQPSPVTGGWWFKGNVTIRINLPTGTTPVGYVLFDGA